MALPRGCVSVVEIVLLLNMTVVTIGILSSPLVLIERFNTIYNYTSNTTATSPCSSDDNATSNSSDLYYSRDWSDKHDGHLDMETFIEGKVSDWSWYLTLASLLPAIPLTAVVFGPWSDVVGRRALLLSGSIGNLCAYLGLLFFHRFQLPFFFIVLTYLLQGFSGGQAAVIGTGFAFISDVSTKEERTVRLTIVEATVFAGSGIGFAIASVITEHFDVVYAILVMVSLLVVQIIYIVFFLKEGHFLKRAKQSTFNEPMSSRVRSHLGRIQYVFFRRSEYRLNLFLVMGTFIFLMVVYLGSSTADVLYYRLRPFCLSQQTIGYVSISKCALSALYAFIIAPIAKKIGISDLVLTVIGLVCFFGSRLLTAFAMNLGLLFASAAIAMPMVVVSAVLRSMMSKMVEPSYQGTLFAVVAGLEALASATGSVVYNNCFHAFSKLSSLPLVTQPAGYTYIVTALIVVPTPFVVLWVHWRQHRHHGYEKVSGTDTATIQAEDI